ncbi:hypothetical protein QMO17_31275, partial [Klebsiella pneumoniae]|nr:hypothetical protein [Klebsiella pneumoniae]
WNAEGVQITHKDSAYDAFHDLQGRGLKSLPVDPDYEEMCRRLTLMAVTPAALEAAISGA